MRGCVITLLWSIGWADGGELYFGSDLLICVDARCGWAMLERREPRSAKLKSLRASGTGTKAATILSLEMSSRYCGLMSHLE